MCPRLRSADMDVLTIARSPTVTRPESRRCRLPSMFLSTSQDQGLRRTRPREVNTRSDRGWTLSTTRSLRLPDWWLQLFLLLRHCHLLRSWSRRFRRQGGERSLPLTSRRLSGVSTTTRWKIKDLKLREIEYSFVEACWWKEGNLWQHLPQAWLQASLGQQ